MKGFFNPGDRIPLPEGDGWLKQIHIFDNTEYGEDKSIWAIRAAMACDRPLLVRGEPGTGKSQLARAVAVKMRLPFLYHPITPESKAQDLLWKFDALARLAMVQGTIKDSKQLREAKKKENFDPLDQRSFVSPGPLWWALNWEGAEEQLGHFYGSVSAPILPAGWKPSMGCVVLIDEIDKSESDLPNSLLEYFGNTQFQVPECRMTVRQGASTAAPLIVITTNEERELPAAFLRRCLVLQLSLPSAKEELIERLITVGKAHFKPEGDVMTEKEFEKLLTAAALQIWEDRDRAASDQISKPGLSEYLDIIRAVLEISREVKDNPGTGNVHESVKKMSPSQILEHVKIFSLVKNPLV